MTRRKDQPRRRAVLSPTMHHYYQAGWADDARLPGWLDGLLMIYDDEPATAALWQEHAEALRDEARLHGFVPWIEQPEADSPERAAWSDAFCTEHKY